MRVPRDRRRSGEQEAERLLARDGGDRGQLEEEVAAEIGAARGGHERGDRAEHGEAALAGEGGPVAVLLGTTGTITFNEVGDRENQLFEVWGIDVGQRNFTSLKTVNPTM